MSEALDRLERWYTGLPPDEQAEIEELLHEAFADDVIPDPVTVDVIYEAEFRAWKRAGCPADWSWSHLRLLERLERFLS
jgi:hypothetical protein